LAGIAIFPDHGSAFVGRAQAQLPDFSSKFLDREPAGLDRLFQKTEQFALQRPMMRSRLPHALRKRMTSSARSQEAISSLSESEARRCLVASVSGLR